MRRNVLLLWMAVVSSGCTPARPADTTPCRSWIKVSVPPAGGLLASGRIPVCSGATVASLIDRLDPAEPLAADWESTVVVVVVRTGTEGAERHWIESRSSWDFRLQNQDIVLVARRGDPGLQRMRAGDSRAD